MSPRLQSLELCKLRLVRHTIVLLRSGKISPILPSATSGLSAASFTSWPLWSLLSWPKTWKIYSLRSKKEPTQKFRNTFPKSLARWSKSACRSTRSCGHLQRILLLPRSLASAKTTTPNLRRRSLNPWSTREPRPMLENLAPKSSYWGRLSCPEIWNSLIKGCCRKPIMGWLKRKRSKGRACTRRIRWHRREAPRWSTRSSSTTRATSTSHHPARSDNRSVNKGP